MNQRTLVYTLIGSIVLNAFLLGVISVHVVSRRSGFSGPGQGGRPESSMDAKGERRGQRLFRELVRAAGGPRDPRVRALWSGQRQHLGEARKSMANSREQVLAALEREPFEREVLAQALNAAEQARQLTDRIATEGTLDLADKLTPQERKTVRRAATSMPEGHDRHRD